ncbi:hypothetical protein SAMN05216276_1017125 [Streptosporangium subroseum]|uniref:PT repeat-containing protein n=1 Tax=Streptosporangium subroseum TaxID=106412 RepID=A0A239HW18_9ACTN|nr:hypothetical protein [Streptosporangium subroseum]SNS84374.1 hypothetical protein SAMN05216276_1017125 [Streptosporangium subroseum]
MTFRRTALLLGVFPILALAGCGGAPAEVGVASVAKTGGASPEASPSTSPDPLKFAQCMRENGIEMADPEPGGPVRIDARGKGKGAVEKAQKACGKYMGGGEGKRRIDPKDQDRLLAFVKCMRENGVDMPDPEIAGGTVRMRRPEGGNDAAMEKAQKACEDHLPGRPATSAGPTG